MRRIAHSGNPHTQWYWDLAVKTSDCPNWIARWFLYHKFRYRDGRNRNPAKGSGSGKHHHSHGHGSSLRHHHKHRLEEQEQDYDEQEEYYPEESMTPGMSSCFVFFRLIVPKKKLDKSIPTTSVYQTTNPSHDLPPIKSVKGMVKSMFYTDFLTAPAPHEYYAGSYSGGYAAGVLPLVYAFRTMHSFVLIIRSSSCSEQWIYRGIHCGLHVPCRPSLCTLWSSPGEWRRRESLLRPCQRYDTLEVHKNKMRWKQIFQGYG
jgi:hypothetical protein